MLDLISIAALLFGLGALAAWVMSAFQLTRWIGTDAARIKTFIFCVILGTVYGAASAIFLGPALLVSSTGALVSAVVRCAAYGACLGGFGGGVAGFFGTLRGRYGTWALAGALGSAAPASWLWIGLGLAAAFEPNHRARDKMVSDTLIICSATIMIGVCLGAALDRALESGRSAVPGVQRLATIINGTNQSERAP